MYISSPYWTRRISRLDRVFRNTTLPLSPLSLCELSSLNHPSLIPPLSSPCDFEAFYQATVPTCARLRLPLSPFFSYRLSPLKISPRGLAPFGRTSWTARVFTTRASHQDYQLDFHLNLLPSFSLGLYCSSAELTYTSTRTFALTPRSPSSTSTTSTSGLDYQRKSSRIETHDSRLISAKHWQPSSESPKICQPPFTHRRTVYPNERISGSSNTFIY